MPDLFSILQKIWMIQPEYVQGLIPHVISYLNGQNPKLPFMYWGDEKPKAYHVRHFDEDKPILSAAKVPVTNEYASEEVPPFSVAYYPVKGVILAESGYYFSTQNFLRNFAMAEANPQIAAHYIEAATPGGDAYMLDLAAKTLEARTKPLVVHFQRVLASAGVYLAAPADKIFATTPFDTIGSVGTMAYFMDFDALLVKLGAKEHEMYATLSELKNKSFRDLRTGNYDAYIAQRLNPLNEAFIATVKRNFPELTQEEAFKGADYFVTNDPGFTDGILSSAEALRIAYELGRNHKMNQLI